MTEYLKTTEVAKALRLTKTTVYRMAQEGEFGETICVGRSIRIPKESFDNFILKNTRKGKGE